jgi:transcriptional regulator with XRE-family HTH domain
MMQRTNDVLRVNEAEEKAGYLDAVAEILRNVQADNELTLLEISEKIGLNAVTTISSAANKKTELNPRYLKRLGQAFGVHFLDPYLKLAKGRGVPLDPESSGDVLPIMTLATARIASARSPNSPGGAVETLQEQLGYLPDLRRLQRELTALICRIEARKDAA